MFPRRTPTCELPVAFRIPSNTVSSQIYTVDVSRIHDNKNVRNSGKAKPITNNIKGPNLAAVKRTTVQESKLLF